MKPRIFYTLSGLCILCSVLLAACSTPIKDAGKEHATSIAKWNELARYSETRFTEYPVVITAQLALVRNDKNYAYQLKNIQLNQKENSYNINLLAPEFEHKYICNPVCYQLLEYVENSPTSGSTLLNEYFSLHEFELFSFYGELYKMNEKLNSLSALNSSGLDDYLAFISMENRKFQTLASFTDYLASQLVEERYLAFLSDPNASAIRRKARQIPGIFEQPLEANASWSLPAKNKAPESAQWQAAIDSDKYNHSELPESRNWQQADFKPRHFTRAGSDKMIHGSFLLAKNEDILPNAYVCSYEDNKFGRVSKLSNNNVDVQLIGQAKLLKDGILYDLEEGALFNGNHPTLTFLPLEGSQSFSMLKVARCYPE